MQIIDADGHVNDRPCMDEISKFMPPGNRTQVFPSFDHSHFHFLEGGEKRSRTGTVRYIEAKHDLSRKDSFARFSR